MENPTSPAAPAPATAAPAEATPAEATEVAASEAPEAPKAPAEIEPTPKDAVERAFEAMDAIDAKRKGEEAPDDPAATTTGPERNPDGTFKKAGAETTETPAAKETKEAKPKAIKEEAPASDNLEEAPSRFSEDAKKEWAKLPASVKGETKRAIRELESGIEGYTKEMEPLKEFAALAKQNGTTIPAALKNYVGLDQVIRKDPIAGFEQIAKIVGIPLPVIAQEIMRRTGQPQPQQQQQQQQQQHNPRPQPPANPQAAAMQNEIARLKQQVGGMATQNQNNQFAQIQTQVNEFAANHPRLEELATEVAQQINMGYKLDEAYSRAEMLSPAPALSTETATAQTRKAALSITGAPASGSNPAHRKPPSSANEAVKNAFAKLG